MIQPERIVALGDFGRTALVVISTLRLTEREHLDLAHCWCHPSAVLSEGSRHTQREHCVLKPRKLQVYETNLGNDGCFSRQLHKLSATKCQDWSKIGSSAEVCYTRAPSLQVKSNGLPFEHQTVITVVTVKTGSDFPTECFL